MDAFVDNLIQPLPYLPIDIVQVCKCAQRPKVLPQIAGSPALYFPFFPTCARIAGPWIEAKLMGEGQEPGIEPDNPSSAFRYGSSEIVPLHS